MNETILVVDDNDMNRMMLVDVLGQWGYEVAEVNHGKAVFGKIDELREKYGDNSEIGTLEDSTAANVVIGLHRDASKGGEILNPIEISH